MRLTDFKGIYLTSKIPQKLIHKLGQHFILSNISYMQSRLI